MNNFFNFFFLFLFFLFPQKNILSEEIYGKVRIIDGDTIEINNESTSYGASIEYELIQSDSTAYIETDYFDVSILTAGTYTFTADIASSGDEATPEDNTITREFVVSDNVYAIDGLYQSEEWMGTGWPGGDDTADGVRYANYFDIKEATKIICGSARSMGIEVKD